MGLIADVPYLTASSLLGLIEKQASHLVSKLDAIVARIVLLIAKFAEALGTNRK
jgi:hypothetical protein